MKNRIRVLLFMCLLFVSKMGLAQYYDSIPVVPSINLTGPRFGVTFIQGRAADGLKELWDVNPVITQFGWQFETRFFTLPNGTTGLVEWVILVGGLEQNVFLPSVSCLIGARDASGLELGFGP